MILPLPVPCKAALRRSENRDTLTTSACLLIGFTSLKLNLTMM